MSVRVVMLWHMHQPDYRDPFTGRFVLPWVRLHSMSAYYDMARLCAEHPKVECTINLTPCLLEQLDDIARNQKTDPHMEVSRIRAEDLNEGERAFILANFFSVSKDTRIAEFPKYMELLAKRDSNGGDVTEAIRVFSDQDMRDLQTLFHLAWFGFFAKTDHEVVKELSSKGSGFSEEEKQALLDQADAMAAKVLDLYRALAENGPAEVCTSPYSHPILPLVHDTACASRCMPGVPLPPRFSRPEDARRQIMEGLELTERILGRRPAGMWPSEGSVSPEVAELAYSCGVEWLVTDEGVLAESMAGAYSRETHLYRPYRFGSGMKLLFRDRVLSDKVGFSYCRMRPERAVQDFLAHAASTARGPGEDAVVTVALDGENPWEHYPDRGRAFLEGLYRSLESNDDLISTTVSQAVNHDCRHLEKLHTGSWIEANFRVWIGEEETNRAWSLLKLVRDQVENAANIGADGNALELAWHELRTAEGSDWFWWFGDMFSSPDDAMFDRLFRMHLSAALKAVDRPVPAELEHPVSSAVSRPVMEPATRLITPKIDGTSKSYFEWIGAARYDVIQARGSMYRSENLVSHVLFGFDARNLYLRLLPHTSDAMHDMARRQIELHVMVDDSREVVLSLDPKSGRVDFHGRGNGCSAPGAKLAAAQVLELSVPFSSLGAEPGDKLGFFLEIIESGTGLDRLPPEGCLELLVPDQEFVLRNWSV